MAAFFNEVTMMGIMNGDPQYFSNEHGRIAVIHLDVKQEWKDKVTGNKESKVETHPIVIFSPSIVEYIEKYIKPGDGLFAKGMLQSRTYTTDKGEVRHTSRMAIGKFNGQLNYIGRPKKDVSPPTQPHTTAHFEHDDIPF